MTNQTDYPPYVIFLEGVLVPGGRIKIEGPHTFELLRPGADMKLGLELTHGETDEIPNLTITLTQTPLKA